MNTPPGGAALAAFRLDDTEIVEAGDPGGMLRQIASSAAQVRTALRVCAEADLSALSPDARPRAIVVAGSGGTGGSSFACDALAATCGVGAPVQVTGVSGYQLPGWIGATDLVVAVSRSGHTAETLALAGEAARRGCDLVAVAAPSSPLQELVLRARGTFIPVTMAGPARAMPWALTVPLLVVAARLGAARIDDDSYEAAAAIMEDVSHQCRPSSESFVNPAKSLALDLVGRLPVIWGGSPVAAAAARRFASQLAANAKYPALVGLLPEAGHDQVATFDGPYAPPPEPAFPAAEDFDEDSFGDDVGFGDDDSLSSDDESLRLVLLADPAGEHPAVARTREAAASLASARGIDVSDILLDASGDPLRRLAGTVQLLDYASVYLGIAGGIDPLAIAAIKDLRDLTGRELNLCFWLRRQSWGWVPYTREGRRRRSRGQPGHRHRQVRGVSHHGVSVNARRVRALAGRHGQRDAAADRPGPVTAGADDRAPVRVRQGKVLLRVRGRGDAVHRRRGLLDLRRHTQDLEPRRA